MANYWFLAMLSFFDKLLPKNVSSNNHVDNNNDNDNSNIDNNNHNNNNNTLFDK